MSTTDSEALVRLIAALQQVDAQERASSQLAPFHQLDSKVFNG